MPYYNISLRDFDPFRVSNRASVKHELSPIFESFRQELNKVTSGGDTAVYDALETARKMLVNYRTDLAYLMKGSS